MPIHFINRMLSLLSELQIMETGTQAAFYYVLLRSSAMGARFS